MSRFGISLSALLVAQLLLWAGLEFTKPERSIHEEKSRALIQMDVKSVKGLELSSESETLRFDLEGGVWRDRNQPNFPVNQKKLVEFLSRITELRRGLPVSFSENSYDRFEVSEEEYVLKVSLEQINNQLTVVYFGKSSTVRQNYVRLGEEDSVFNVDIESWELDSTRDNWLNKEYLNLTSEGVSSFSLNGLTFLNKNNGFELQVEDYDHGKVDKFSKSLFDLQLRSFVQDGYSTEKDIDFVELFNFKTKEGSLGQVFVAPSSEEESYLIKRSDKKGLFKIAAFNVDPIRATTLADFLSEVRNDS